MVSPRIIQLSLGDQRVIPGPQSPYVAQPGDQVAAPNPPDNPHRFVTRHGTVIGTLVGPNNDLLWTWDVITGSPLDPGWADARASYRLSSPTDPNYATPKMPAAVFRKSKPNGYARAAAIRNDVTLQHELFLHLPDALVPGAEYTLTFHGHPYPGGTLAPRTFTCDPATLRSPAVHVSQLGFHPNDPAKVAFLSTWMGSGGPLDYAVGTPFSILDDATGQPVFTGGITLQKKSDVTEINSMAGAKNTSLTNVYQMDFSGLTTPGTYRVSVAGIGCSYPFTLAAGVWESAFKLSVKALYNQRSGLALSTAHTNYNRPLDHHPDDPGVTIRLSRAPLLDGANGLDNDDPNNFVELIAGLLPADRKLGREAWGGYHDAGDWDRRIQHLEASIWLLTLVEEFPVYFGALNLNLPESGGAYPDMVDEALWNIDFFRRLQITTGPDAGGVRGGIEHDAHPRLGEAGWQDTNLIIAFAPDPWSSHWYAGAAAMAAHWLRSNGFAAPAAGYEASAVNAYRWALARKLSNYEMGSRKEITDMRNFAAAALFRLTGEAAYHADFVKTTDFAQGLADTSGQRFGSWTYVRTNRPEVDAAIRTNIISSYVADADTLVRGGNDTGFRWTMNPRWLYGIGTFSTSLESPTLVKAHLLTRDPRYLSTLVLSCQTGAGANPDNRCYTTGLGSNPVRHPLDADSCYFRDMPTPPGLTTLGPADFSAGLSMGVFPPHYWPASKTWPIIECYHDLWLDPMLTEYTVHHPITQNFVAWGYLAAVSR
ncbi:MAG: glycoside hydrolase family 9 protein [Opitutae bacterium]|nr:glycoside hydrolase family 9 protein [Opitutae bacterium]